jgi:hypothetical protein
MNMKDEQTFQSKTQLRLLEVHSVLVKVASYLYTPVRLFLESFTGTPALREENARTLKVIK